MKKKYLGMSLDEKGFIEVEPEKATQVSVSLKDMEQLERTLEDQRDHIMKLQQIIREKSNRELNIRPARSESGYKLWRVEEVPEHRLQDETKTVTAYQVTITTPWKYEDIDFETAKKMWMDDAEKVCAAWGLRYFPSMKELKDVKQEGLWALHKKWEALACAVGGKLSVHFTKQKTYRVTFWASKPPKWNEEKGEGDPAV